MAQALGHDDAPRRRVIPGLKPPLPDDIAEKTFLQKHPGFLVGCALLLHLRVMGEKVASLLRAEALQLESQARSALRRSLEVGAQRGQVDYVSPLFWRPG